MPSVKSFTVSSRAEVDNGQPLPFLIEWKDENGDLHPSPPCTVEGCKVTDPHSWHARPWLIPDLVLMQILDIPNSEDLSPFFNLFRDALRDDYPSFQRFVNSPEVFVDLEQFRPLLEWFVEEGAGRPTRPSSR